VRPDGALEVAETQAISFQGQLQHGYRVIPLGRTMGISDVSVSEVTTGREQLYVAGSQQPGTFTTQRVSDGLAVDWWFQPASDTPRTFTIRYVAQDAVRQYSGGDQADWQAVYADRDGAVQGGTVTVHLPADTPPDATPSALYLISNRPGPAQE